MELKTPSNDDNWSCPSQVLLTVVWFVLWIAVACVIPAVGKAYYEYITWLMSL